MVRNHIFFIINSINVFVSTELEDLQLVFLKTLLNDNDQTDTTVSSRVLFSRRFQTFVQETMIFWKVYHARLS